MDSNMRTARTAGLMYLIVVVGGMFGLLYIPSQVVVRGDALATATNIQAHESLFRFGIATGLITETVFFLLPFVLYKLLRQVDKTLAGLMVALCIASVPFAFSSMTHDLDILTLLSGAEFLKAFTTEQLHAQVMLALKASGHAALLAELFWGLWLLPFGWLVFRSGFLPRFLGVFLIVNGFAYLALCFTGRLIPQHNDLVARITFPALFGEMAIMLWLLIMGAKEPMGVAQQESR